MTVPIAPVLLALCALQAGAQSLAVHLTADAAFHEGERIPLEIAFQAPPQVHYQFRGVLIDPNPGCGDLPHPCHVLDMHTFSKADPLLNLAVSARTLHADLNLYVPRLKPGRYRAALLLSMLVQKVDGPWTEAAPPRYLVSNRISFEIIPASPAFIQRTVAEATAILQATEPNSAGGYELRLTAARRLRYLQHPLAWEASLASYNEQPGGNDLLFGLWESPHPAEVCALMQARIPNPAQYVSAYYLRYLADICMRAEPDYDPGKWDAEVLARHSRILGSAADSLAAGLSKKSGATKGAAIYGLLEYIQSTQNGVDHPATVPGWLPEVRRQAAAAYFDLPPYLQPGLLTGESWRWLRGPEMVSLIRTILAAKSVDYSAAQNWNLALTRLHEVAPAEARALLLAELRNPETRVQETTLSLLPPEAVPAVDNDLIQTLAEAQKHPAGNPRIAMLMIARYASSGALQRIRAIFESQHNPCQPELMAYFLRTDSGYADAVFHRHPWDMHRPAPCALEYFRVTPPLRMHPAMEKYLTAYLMHEDVRLKETAADSLGRYGIPAAEPALWAAYRYFHDFWKTRPREVTPMSANEMLECALRNAIARARHWLVRDPGLRLIEDLCITDRCRWETRSDLEQARPPLRVSILANTPEDFRASLAQYTCTSRKDLADKLAQFPTGTAYEFSNNGKRGVGSVGSPELSF